MREMMKGYRDLPTDLADAVLMRVAEREKRGTLFTLDHRDFRLFTGRFGSDGFLLSLRIEPEPLVSKHLRACVSRGLDLVSARTDSRS